MSQQIVCTNCQAGNPLGSKFCSNCGERLPQSAQIVCPHCETLNESDRIFCDNCGRRLVEDDTPLSQEESKEEEPQSGPQAFSLPTRKPGETGELNPGLLPDWLRTGENLPSELDDQVEGAEQAGENSGISTDELTNIEEIKSDNALTDDLPDWLLDQIDSEPIIPQSAGITTELYLDLVNNPDLPDLEDEVTRIEDDPENGEGANLPDWLQQPSEGDDIVSLNEESEEQVGLESDIDVLAGLTDILKDQTNELIPPDESGIGLTDWLSDPADEDGVLDDDGIDEGSGVGLTDWLNDSATLGDDTGELSATQGSGLTEILNDPDPLLDSDLTGVPDGNEAEQDIFGSDDLSSGQKGEGAGLTDWLTNLEELGDSNEGEDWLEELSGQEAGASDWLEGLDKLTESQMNLEDDSSEDDFEEDWLANLAESQGPQSEEASKDESLSVTDWLSDPDGIEKFEEQIVSERGDDSETAVSDAMDVLFNDDLSFDEIADNSEDLDSSIKEDGPLPDWLSADADAGQDDETVQSELDWMFETGGVELPESGENSAQDEPIDNLFDDALEDDLFGDSFSEDVSEEDAPPQVAEDDDSFDWLSDLKDIQTGALEVPDPVEEPDPVDIEEEPEVIEEAPPEEEPPIPDPVNEDWSGAESENLGDMIPESLPDWMDELGPPVSNEASDGFGSEVEEEIESELPEWLTQMRPGDEGLIGSSLPSALNPDLVDDNALELPDLSMEVEKGDLPDWLANEAAGGLPDILENESEDIPDWLVESETGSSSGDKNSDWDSSLLDKLPPPQSEPELVEATIPDWLEKFKPEELKSGESLLDSNSGLALVEDELQDGAIAGLSGIIKIEPPILPSKPSSAPSSLQISPDQTKQIELLQQLLNDDETEDELKLVDTAVAFPNIWNLLIIIFTMIAVGLVWARPALFPLEVAPPELVANAAYETLESTTNETVLVAFEHTPAMNGELNYQNEAMLALLQAQGNDIIAVTQHPTTVGIISDYDEIDADQLIFLPGEAVGLRLLGDCLSGDSSACLSIPALSVVDQAEIETIVLVTSERDSLINWIEQVSSVVGENTMLLSTTSALEPVAKPYQLSGQIDGIMTHQVFAAQTVADDTTADRLRQQANASAAAQVIAIILLIVVLVIYGIRPSQQGGQAVS